ncbi:4a-hydroxytetrahydrobiopterin dehydratase [Streptomyces sp. enrichment culture]|uniref:4a-hydroxytetrahydrobiopterin dehydratase n=1 Tax=Streptomyces sp. enrichment culture TaxID=1795815 RepID=UPI003F57BFAB
MSRVIAQEPRLVADPSSGLPDEYGTVFTEPDAAPGRTSRATDAPAPLSEEDLAGALRQRRGGRGDTHELSRTVALPPDRVDLLLTQMEYAADDLGHRPRTERTGDGVRFTVQTRSVAAVTRRDPDLADRIDDAVMTVGGGSAG